MTVEELQAEVAKRDEQIRAISTKLQANERIVRELGESVERDAYGNPLRLVVEDEPATPPAPPVTTGAHGNPWGPLATYIPEFNPQSAEAYFQQQFQELLKQQGYVTEQQARALMQQAAQIANGNNAVWRMYDRLTGQDPYKGLADHASKLYERTAKVLRDRNLGVPLTHDPVTGQPLQGAVPFDRWRYQDLESLRLAADLADMELGKEAKAAAEAAKAAGAAQAADNLSPAPGTPPGTAGQGKPDFTTMKTPEDIEAALNASLSAAGTV